MRIVFLSYSYSPDIDSPQAWMNRIKYYTGWAECLATDHEVIRVDQINYEGSCTHNGIQYYFVDDGKRKNYFPARLNRFVQALNPDLVLVSSFLAPLQVIQLRGCLGKNVKIILQHHAEKPMTGFKKYVQRYAASKANGFLFAAAEIGYDWVEKRNLPGAERIFELMEVSSSFAAVDKLAARAKTNVCGPLAFLWVGRLNENKDPLTAVQAFLQFARLHSAARLYMIYQSATLLPAVQQVLNNHQHSSQVILVGNVAHSNMQYWFSSADFYLSASHYEGSGTALCEAMCCGCIPVVTAIPSFKKMTEQSTCGFLYPPGNVAALATVMNTVATIDVISYAEKVKRSFNEHLSFSSIAATFSRIITQL